jgi:hypothetical protein
VRSRWEATARSVRATLARLADDAADMFRHWPRLQPLPPTDEAYATIVAANDDDPASVTGRIDTASDMTVVLVVPTRARGFRDPGMWPHVAAHVRRRGITLGVVCSRRDVRGHAAENGLPAARSISGLFRPPRRRLIVGRHAILLPHFPLRRLLTLGMAAVLILAVGFVGCVALPSASVVVVPPSEPLTTTLHAKVSALSGVGDVAGAIVPASPMRLTVHTVVSTTATGSVDVPDAPATVDLTFTNTTGAPLAVPPLTNVTTESGIEFRTDTTLDLPGKESGTVQATAVEAGTTGNVKAGTLQHATGLPEGITVTNRRAAAGGTDKTVTAIAQDDFDRISAIADDVLRRVGLREIQASLKGDGVVFPETLNVAILGFTPLGSVGDPADAVLVEYRAVATALGLPDETLRAFGEQMLAGAARPGFTVVPGTAAARVTGETAQNDGTVSVDLLATGRVTRELATHAIGAAIAGERPGAAARHLEEMLHLDTPPDITIHPSIVPWQWLPRRAGRITVELGAPPAPEATPTPSATDGATTTPTLTPTPTGTPDAAASAR